MLKDLCSVLFSEMEVRREMMESLKFLILKAFTYIRDYFCPIISILLNAKCIKSLS